MGKLLDKIAPVFKRRSRQFDLEDYIERQKKRGFVGALQEVDGTPIAPPIGYVPHVPLHLQIREMVRSEALRQAAESSDLETFEEADDFDIDDDPVDPKSPYENDFDPAIRELLKEGHEILQEKDKAKPKEPSAGPRPEDAGGGDSPPAKPPVTPPPDKK